MIFNTFKSPYHVEPTINNQEKSENIKHRSKSLFYQFPLFPLPNMALNIAYNIVQPLQIAEFRSGLHVQQNENGTRLRRLAPMDRCELSAATARASSRRRYIPAARKQRADKRLLARRTDRGSSRGVDHGGVYCGDGAARRQRRLFLLRREGGRGWRPTFASSKANFCSQTGPTIQFLCNILATIANVL